VLALSKQGLTIAAIAARLKHDPRTISGVIAIARQGGRPGIRRRSRVNPERVRELYATGETKAEIGRRLGLHVSTVKSALGSGGARPTAAEQPEPPVLRDNNIQQQKAFEILRLVAAGYSDNAIRRRLGFGPTTIARVKRIASGGGVALVRGRKSPVDQRAAIARRRILVGELAKQSISMSEIARRLGVSSHTVKRDLLAEHTPEPHHPSKRQRVSAARAARRAEARVLSNEGLDMGGDRASVESVVADDPRRLVRSP
jgi:DNA-binding CsgD family transcriptional regulator